MSHRELKMGVDNPQSLEQIICNEQLIKSTVRHYIPEFVQAVEAAVNTPARSLLIHQEAFAAEYQDDECLLLGMAIKYAGMCKINVLLIADSDSDTGNNGLYKKPSWVEA